MKLKKLIGFYICTNQYWTGKIRSVKEAEKAIKGLFEAYDKSMLKEIYRRGNTFSAYHINDKVETETLHSFLNN